MARQKVTQLLAAAAILAALAAIFVFAIQECWQDAPFFAIPYSILSVTCGLLCLICLDITRYNPADSHSLRSLFGQYAMIAVLGYVSGWLCLRKYRRQLKNCKATQDETLQWIITLNSETVYGKDHNIGKIRSREDLVRQHPLTTYSHYEKYTQRVAKGEKNVMTKADIAILAVSSGTTGKNKMYPFTLTFRKRMGTVYVGSAHYKFAELVAPVGLQRWFQFRLFHPPMINEHGIQEGGVGNVIARPSALNVTPECFLKAHNEPASYCIQSVFALAEREIGLLDGYSSDLWYSFFRFISAHHELLCDTIESGVLPPFTGIDEELRWEVNRHIKADPARAAELRQVFAGPTKGIAKRIWPNLATIACAKSGGFKHSALLLQESHVHGIRMMFIVHMATEGLLGMTFDDPIDSDVYTLATSCTFVEFIPVEHMEDETPKTLFADQLQVGGKYELVVTNADGLYRNRFGDVIEVVGYTGDTPKYKFLYRTGQILNIAFDRTPEKIFYDAVEKTSKETEWADLEIVNYTATESMHLEKVAGELPDPAFYATFMEIVRDGELVKITDDQVRQLDTNLGILHETYKEFQDLESIGPMRIYQVMPGTFVKLRDVLSGGKMNNQFKTPRVLRKEMGLKLLWDNRVKD